MLQDMWTAPPGFRPHKSVSAPCSSEKPLAVPRTSSEPFHITHKVPVGDTPYVTAKHVQLVEKDPEKAIPLFWAAINAGDRVDSALKDMAIVMKQQNRGQEAIEAIKSLRSRCSDQAQEALDNILLDLYKKCGRLDDQVALLRHKLFLIQQGLAFNGKRTKTARSQGKKFQVSVEQEATRLLGNLGWALMQKNNYIEAEDAYNRALSIAPDNNKMCNLGICLMNQGKIAEAKETLRRVRPAVADGPRGTDSHLKAYERAQQMLADLESETMKKAGESVLEQSRLFYTFLGSSSIWQPQPCKENATFQPNIKTRDEFPDENTNSNIFRTNSSNNINNQKVPPKPVGGVFPFGNPLSVNAPPFLSTKFIREPLMGSQFLKRTRSGNEANFGTEINQAGEHRQISTNYTNQERESKMLRRSFEEPAKKPVDFLPDDKDIEEAIISAVLSTKPNKFEVKQTSSVDKRLKVFQDMTLSLSPKARGKSGLDLS